MRNDIGKGAVYESELIADNAGNAVAPPWFQPAINAVLTVHLAPLIRSSNITHNLLCGDGYTRPFKIVPFVNGDDPVHPPPGGAAALPHLTNVGVISNLTGPQATSYLNGYHIVPVPNLIIDRKNLIRVEIGCTAEF